MAKGGGFSCRFCGRSFTQHRDLEKHLQGENCDGMNDTLFLCMRCNNFCTHEFTLLQSHLASCPIDIDPPTVVKGYQAQIAELEAKVEEYEAKLQEKQGIPFPKTVKSPPKNKTVSRKKDQTSSHTEQQQDVEVVNNLDEIFGTLDEKDPRSFMMKQYAVLHDSRRYASELKKIKQMRRAIFKAGDLDAYYELLESNLKALKLLCEKKGFNERKTSKQIRSHFTALDMRLARMDGHQKLTPDGPSLRELSLVLSSRAGDLFFDCDQLSQNMENLTIAFFPLEDIIKRELTRHAIVYMGKLNTKDPYMFYTRKSKKEWIMDCRLLDIATHLRSSVRRYGVHLFRYYYSQVFQDNEFREDFCGNGELQGLTNECKMLLKNLLLLEDANTFHDLLIRLVKKNNYRKRLSSDNLNLQKPDLLRTELKDTEYVCLVKELFDTSFEDEAEAKTANLRLSISCS